VQMQKQEDWSQYQLARTGVQRVCHDWAIAIQLRWK